MLGDDNDDNDDVSVGVGDEFFSGGFAVLLLSFSSCGVSLRCVSNNDNDGD